MDAIMNINALNNLKADLNEMGFDYNFELVAYVNDKLRLRKGQLCISVKFIDEFDYVITSQIATGSEWPSNL